MILDATPGGSASNSYVTVDDATMLLEGRLHTDPWYDWDTTTSALSSLEEQQGAALITATRLLDTLVAWRGTPTSLTQALAWPQMGQVDRYGRLLSALTVPLVIQQATAFYALALLRDDSENAATMADAGLKSKRMGDLALVFQDRSPPPPSLRLPAEIRAMLAPYGAVSGGVVVRLLRT